MTEVQRQLPNILITGTPGTGMTLSALRITYSADPPLVQGKTSHCSQLVESLSAKYSFRHINCGDLVKEKSLHTGWDEEWQSYDVDDDKVCAPLSHVAAQSNLCHTAA